MPLISVCISATKALRLVILALVAVKSPIVALSNTTTHTANSYYKLIAFPLYSLNILLPVKLMPTMFVKTKNFPAIGEDLKNAKLAGSILRIPISSILSKLITLNEGEKRILLNLITKKDDKGNIISKVKATIGDIYNLSYYKKVMGVRTYHYLEGTQNGATNQINATLLTSINSDQSTLQEAINMLPQMKKAEENIPTYKGINSQINSGPTERYKARTRNLRENLIANNAYIKDNGSNETYMVNTNMGPQIVTEDQLRNMTNSVINFTDPYGNIVFTYKPGYHNFDL